MYQPPMADDLESQIEEEEALLAIYDGDSAFKQLSATVYQYLCGENGSANSILVEISWPPSYPTEKPNINLNTFYNQHIDANAKQFFSEKIIEKAEQYLGVAMTYTLIELVKDNVEAWFTEVSKYKPKTPTINDRVISTTEDISNLQVSEVATKKESKKEQLSKAQKRRQWNRCDATGEKPRGWDWVDIIKHLSQTGGRSENNDNINNT